MYIHKYILLSVIILMQCTFFQPVQPEYPSKPPKCDPLNFKQILSGTQEKFEFRDYDGLFHDAFKFYNPLVLGSRPYSKSQILNRLSTIIHNDESDKISVNVSWSLIDTTVVDCTIFLEEDTVFIEPDRIYSVVICDSTLDPIVTVTYRGQASIKIVKQNLNWVIIEWYDKNIVVGEQLSQTFFCPEYQ